jgi:hypothetical protein
LNINWRAHQTPLVSTSGKSRSLLRWIDSLRFLHIAARVRGVINALPAQTRALLSQMFLELPQRILGSVYALMTPVDADGYQRLKSLGSRGLTTHPTDSAIAH